ncbi:MAG: hypothetical protein ILP07_11460 [Treponema sp.]|nr:hypothetical protein [Treponema sp.]
MKSIIRFIILMFLAVPIFADEPMPPPETYTICSQNKRYFLICDAEENLTTCYELFVPEEYVTDSDSLYFAREKWNIPQWYLYARVSNNGEFCILDDWGGLVHPDFGTDYVLFMVYRNGEEYAKILLSDVISETRNLKRTVSHFYWGGIESLEDDGILLDTVEGKKWYDFATKKVLVK